MINCACINRQNTMNHFIQHSRSHVTLLLIIVKQSIYHVFLLLELSTICILLRTLNPRMIDISYLNERKFKARCKIHTTLNIFTGVILSLINIVIKQFIIPLLRKIIRRYTYTRIARISSREWYQNECNQQRVIRHRRRTKTDAKFSDITTYIVCIVILSFQVYGRDN